jgi:hypothetical protein
MNVHNVLGPKVLMGPIGAQMVPETLYKHVPETTAAGAFW